jgi:hypothetical protein
MIIGVESLKRLLENYKTPDHCRCQGKCYVCGRDVEVKITKTSGGFGLSGGILLEQSVPNPTFLCVDCHEAGADSQASEPARICLTGLSQSLS